MKRLSIAMAVMLMISVWLAACGTGSAGGAVGAVQNWLAAYAQFDSKGVLDLTCAAQKTSITQEVSIFGNTDLAQLKDLFTFDFSKLTFKESSNDGKTAIIHLGGKVTMKLIGQTQTQDMDQDLPVVFEGGQWRACGDLPTLK